jgi:hypothetical protein
MSLEETVRVSLMEALPTSGNGTLGAWRSLRQARARLDKTEHITVARARGEAVSKLREGGEYAYQRLNLVTMGKAQKRKAKTSNRTREIRPSGIIRGPRET